MGRAQDDTAARERYRQATSLLPGVLQPVFGGPVCVQAVVHTPDVFHVNDILGPSVC